MNERFNYRFVVCEDNKEVTLASFDACYTKYSALTLYRQFLDALDAMSMLMNRSDNKLEKLVKLVKTLNYQATIEADEDFNLFDNDYEVFTFHFDMNERARNDYSNVAMIATDDISVSADDNNALYALERLTAHYSAIHDASKYLACDNMTFCDIYYDYTTDTMTIDI